MLQYTMRYVAHLKGGWPASIQPHYLEDYIKGPILEPDDLPCFSRVIIFVEKAFGDAQRIWVYAVGVVADEKLAKSMKYVVLSTKEARVQTENWILDIKWALENFNADFVCPLTPDLGLALELLQIGPIKTYNFQLFTLELR